MCSFLMTLKYILLLCAIVNIQTFLPFMYAITSCLNTTFCQPGASFPAEVIAVFASASVIEISSYPLVELVGRLLCY